MVDVCATALGCRYVYALGHLISVGEWNGAWIFIRSACSLLLQVLPIIASMIVAGGWCAYMSGRHLFTSPDVSFNRERRQAILKDPCE